MQDVRLGLLAIERTDVARRRDALPELLHLGSLQDLAELGLSDQEALQQRMVAELKVGEHPQLLDSAGSQVLGLVDDEKAALALAGMREKERLERGQQLGFRAARRL